MKKLLSLFVLSSFLGFSFANAEEGGENPPMGQGKNFEEHKAHMIGRLDEKIKDLQTAKACMSNAKNHDEMKTCRKEAKEEREDDKQERKEFREGRRGDRKKMRQERRNKRGGQSSSSDAQQ